MKSNSDKAKKNKQSSSSSTKCYYDWLACAEKMTFKAWLKNNQ